MGDFCANCYTWMFPIPEGEPEGYNDFYLIESYKHLHHEADKWFMNILCEGCGPRWANLYGQPCDDHGKPMKTEMGTF